MQLRSVCSFRIPFASASQDGRASGGSLVRNARQSMRLSANWRTTQPRRICGTRRSARSSAKACGSCHSLPYWPARLALHCMTPCLPERCSRKAWIVVKSTCGIIRGRSTAFCANWRRFSRRGRKSKRASWPFRRIRSRRSRPARPTWSTGSKRASAFVHGAVPERVTTSAAAVAGSVPVADAKPACGTAP